MDNRGKIALVQIIILLFGLIAFVYFVGDEIGIVSADAKEAVDSGTSVKEAVDSGGISGSANTPPPGVTKLPTPIKPSSTASGFLGIEHEAVDGVAPDGVSDWQVVGSEADAVVSGLQWAVGAYMAGQMIGSLIGMTDDNTGALSTSLAGGAGVYKALDTYAKGTETGWFSEAGYLGGHPVLAGAAIAAVIFISMYKDIETKVVEFNCMPWQSPSGGNSCEVCND